MPTQSEYEQIKAALLDWQEQVVQALEQDGPPPDAPPSEIIPPHVVEMIQRKLAQTGSPYHVKVAFEEATQTAKYPPGFESPHPAYLAYTGPGIPAADHVQSHLFDFECHVCRSTEHVIVLSSEWGVNIQSGDARGKFKARCTHCGESFFDYFED